MDDHRRIKKFSPDGTLLAEWPYGYDGLAFGYPVGMTSDSRDNIYVVEHIHDIILKFSTNGTFLKRWDGASDAIDGISYTPYAIASDSRDNIYIEYIEYPPHIVVFSPNGTFLATWDTTDPRLDGPVYTGSFVNGHSRHVKTQPTAITIDSADNLYVVDHWQDSIKKFSTDGTFLEIWDTGDYMYGGPYGIASDSRDNLYVIGFSEPDIFVFKPAQHQPYHAREAQN